MPISSQLPLGLGLDDDARFENFLLSARNRQAIECLQGIAQNSTAGDEQAEHFVYVWGGGSPGLTHLLQAVCHQTSLQQHSSLYLPMLDRAQFAPEILDSAGSIDLICVDDIQEIAGDSEWEAALFTAFNSIRDAQSSLIVAAHCSPSQLGLQLPDLKSRMQSGLVFQIAELDDDEKLLALQSRASNRGMELTDAVAEFILLRSERRLSALMEILDKLDRRSLQEQRRITIPLVKSTMNW